MEQRDPTGMAVGHLVAARDFAGLDTLAREYRTTKSRDINGEENLHLFYRWLVHDLIAMTSCDGCDDKGTDFVHAWLARSPKDVVATITLGKIEVLHAFAVRGRGYADAVPPEVWPRVRELNGQAYQALMDAKSFASLDPEWYSTYLEAALIQQPPEAEVRATFNEGAKKFPGYLPIYESMTTYLLPEWNGDWKAVDALARAASSGPQDGNLGMYARIYRLIGRHCSCGRPLRTQTEIDWSLMKRSMRAWADRYPSEWNMVSFMRLSCDSDDYIEAQYFIGRRIALQTEAGQVVSGVTACGVPPGRFKPA
ncbi:MAG: hypothetical protein JO290_02920 [Sphingomonadaceae bacterium]|nr:hypothetical protein [Sphingomonadaceae bacterium]